SGVLGELSDAVGAAASADDVAALSDSVAELSGVVEGKAGQDVVDALAEQVASLGEEVDASALQGDLDAFVEDVRAEFDAMDADLSALGAQQASTQAQLDDLSTTVDGKASQDDVDGLAEGLSVLSGDVADLMDAAAQAASADDVAALGDSVAELSGVVEGKAGQDVVDALAEQVASLGEEVDASALQGDFDAFVEDVRAEFDAMDADVVALGAGLAAAQARLVDLTGSVDGLLDDVSDLDARQSATQAQLDDVTAAVDTKADAESVDSNFTDLANAIGEQAAVLVSFDQTNTDLQNQITDVAAELAATIADAGASAAVVNDSLQALAEQVDSLQGLPGQVGALVTSMDDLSAMLSQKADAESVDANFDDIAGALGDQAAVLVSLDSANSDLENQVTDLASAIALADSNLDAFAAATSSTLDQLTAGLGTLTDRVADAESAISGAATTTALQAVYATLDTFKADRSDIGALQEQFNTLWGRVDGLVDSKVSVSSFTTVTDELAQVTATAAGLSTRVGALESTVDGVVTAVQALQAGKADKTEVAELRGALCDAATFAHSKDADYPVPAFCPAS
ncbi:MAG: hypothetical protein KGP01_02945, partial [Actinomycetales bacterium]|nr:hypothetical protein [Actinomycetales bacterium]